MQKVLLVLVALLFSQIANAGTAINTTDGIALGGYDAVAYFTKKSATKGDPQFSHEWAGAKWVFSSSEHRDLFATDPDKYAPQYGGNCAYLVAMNGSKSNKPATGEFWTNVNGKIYLFPDARSSSAWFSKGPGQMIRWGDEAWPKLKATLEAK